ncbi:nitroreductase family protein [Candidatus Bipolaricaulota bacterium]|nr:nitroreductase family protein [Candidatus Bipolaricaulota bacterium]
MGNPVLEVLAAHRSIRRYTADVPSDEMVEAIVRAGQQAPFSGQLASVVLVRDARHNPWNAPLLFTLCVDMARMERVMAKRNWTVVTHDLSMLWFGIQDASLMAQNMIVAAESLGLGTCLLGAAPFMAKALADRLSLPRRVFPVVQLTIGYPDETPPTRPRYPLDVSLHEGRYRISDEETIERAMREMDEGYLAQDYYREAGAMIPLEGGRAETFTYDTYSWTEHISRKWGQWMAEPTELTEPLRQQGFHIGADIDDPAG